MNLNQLNADFSKLPKEFSKDLLGQWVAVSEGKIVAHNQSFKVLFLEIKKEGKEKQVLFHKVPQKEIIIV